MTYNNTHAAKVPGIQPDGTTKLVTRFVSNQSTPEITLDFSPFTADDLDVDWPSEEERDAIAEREAERAAERAAAYEAQRQAKIDEAAALEAESAQKLAAVHAARAAKYPGTPDYYTGHHSQEELLEQRDKEIHDARWGLSAARSHIQMVAGRKYNEVAGELRIPWEERGQIQFERFTANVDWNSVHPDARESVKKEHDRVVAVYTDAAVNREKFAMDLYTLGAAQPPFMAEPLFYNAEPIDAREYLRTSLNIETGEYLDRHEVARAARAASQQ